MFRPIETEKKKENRKLAGSSLFARCLFVFIVNETSFWSQSRIDEVRIEFGFLHCGDLATAAVSRRTTLVAACRARVFVIETAVGRRYRRTCGSRLCLSGGWW